MVRDATELLLAIALIAIFAGAFTWANLIPRARP
jgi:hypothetical protein